MEPEALVYTYYEIATLLKSKKSAIRSLVRSGAIKHVVIGHSHLIPAHAIKQFLRDQATTETHSERRPARLR